MHLTTLALAFNEWGVGRFPLDLVIFFPIFVLCALPALINKKKIFVEGDAFTSQKF
tara:strand:- start:1621 stop:1788 length:168 start_codon:yes stop_codon:yes gene_type:complete